MLIHSYFSSTGWKVAACIFCSAFLVTISLNVYYIYSQSTEFGIGNHSDDSNRIFRQGQGKLSRNLQNLALSNFDWRNSEAKSLKETRRLRWLCWWYQQCHWWVQQWRPELCHGACGMFSWVFHRLLQLCLSGCGKHLWSLLWRSCSQGFITNKRLEIQSTNKIAQTSMFFKWPSG